MYDYVLHSDWFDGFTSFPYASRWCTVSNDLYTTTQFAFCVRSTNKLANCGIDTFGSFVQCTKSANEREQQKRNYFHVKIRFQLQIFIIAREKKFESAVI